MLDVNTMDMSMIQSKVISSWAGGIAGLNEGLIKDCNNLWSIVLYTNSTGNADGIAGYNNGVLQNNNNYGTVETYYKYTFRAMQEKGQTLPQHYINAMNRAQAIYERPDVQQRIQSKR